MPSPVEVWQPALVERPDAIPRIDCTNPGAADELGQVALTHAVSNQHAGPGPGCRARVVRSLNQVGAEIMADTRGFAHAPIQFMAGNNWLSRRWRAC